MFNMNIKDFILMIISISSFFISIITLFKNRKRIEYYWQENIHAIYKDEIFIVSDNKQLVPLLPGYATSIDLINPTPTDIAYFDLRAFNPKTNCNLYLLTNKTLDPSVKCDSITRYWKDGQTNLTIPPANYGILKANSYTRFDLFIMSNVDELKEIEVSLKVLIKAKLFKDPFALTKRKKYKVIRYRYNLLDKRDN